MLGGGREPGDDAPEVTLRRELSEEAPGLHLTDLTPYSMEKARSIDGLTVPVQVFTGRWNGEPDTAQLREGVLLRWFTPDTLDRLRLSPGLGDLIRRHATQHHPSDSTPPAHDRLLPGEAPKGTEPHIVGVHLYLEDARGRILLGRRHPGSAFAPGQWHFLAGHCEREEAVDCLVREAEEEAGLGIEPGEVELVHVLHLVDSPSARPRIGLFFRARTWSGTPTLREPDTCVWWRWWNPKDLPDDVVPYTRQAIAEILAGHPYSQQGWEALGGNTATTGRETQRATQPADSGLQSPAAVDPAAARTAIVARLEESEALRPGPVRSALLALPREVLMPQAYVRRSAPGEGTPRWDLLDWATPQDRPELLERLYGGTSVLIQHGGEPLLGRARGSRSGASITSMSTVMAPTARLLQELDLRPGQRMLDIGTGTGMTAAVACHICGDQRVVTLDLDRHLTDAAAARLADLGFQPKVVCASGELGVPGRKFDRIFISYTAQHVPAALVEQLAPGGRLLMNITTASPSWPALAVVERTVDGRLTGQLRPVDSAHRPGHGMNSIVLSEEFRQRIANEPGSRTRRTTLAPPAGSDRGLWLAADHLLGGLVHNSRVEHLEIGAPGCGSWLRVKPAGNSSWDVAVQGPRDIWTEIQDLARRWRAADSPTHYRLHFDPEGGQRAASACGRLSWDLPAPHLVHEEARS